MDDVTPQAAAFEPRIGHPATYIDYSTLAVDRIDILDNIIRSEEFRHRLQRQRFPKLVDRTLWNMTPQTANAYYSLLNVAS